MKQLMVALALFCLSNSVLRAHHEGDPGNSPLGGAVLSAHLLESGKISLGWNSSFVFYPQLSSAELEAKVRAQGPNGKVQVPEMVAMQSLDLGFGAQSWLQLNVAMRSIRIERLREGHMHGDGSYGSHEFGSPSGLANTELRLKARLAAWDHGSMGLLVSGTLPTGEDNALTDGVTVDGTANTTNGKLRISPKFAYLSPAFQPGSGASQGVLALAASQEWGLWACDASLTAVVPAAYRKYKPGNSLSTGVAMGHMFGEEGHERGWLGLEIYATQAEPSNTDGRGADDGGFSLGGGPRLRLPLGSRGLAVLGVGIPLVKPAWQDPAPVAMVTGSLQAIF